MATFRRLVPAPAAMRRATYPSDLTDAQWALLEPLLRERDTRSPGRPASGIVDSQTAKTAEASQDAGWDGGK